jgi:hypothetical protein
MGRQREAAFEIKHPPKRRSSPEASNRLGFVVFLLCPVVLEKMRSWPEMCLPAE